MEIYISIDGVLRNFLQKFEHHYVDYFLNSDQEENSEDIEPIYEYGFDRPINNIDDFKFQSKDERDVFMYLEFPLEIFGYAGLNSSSSISDINKVMFDNKNHNFTVIGLNEYGKAKPSSLFFLSKNGFLGNNIKFITCDDLKKEWKKCDLWITDNKEIIDSCPRNKKCVKFNNQYNMNYTYKKEINSIKEIEELCIKSLEKNIISTLMVLLINVKTFFMKYLIVNKKQKMNSLESDHQ